MTIQRAHQSHEVEEWLTVQDACSLLGVSPATLRRWSAAGDVQAFTTPGGHRRFARSTILGLLPDAGRGRPTLGELGVTPERMTRAYRRNMRQATRGVGWIARLDDKGLATLRLHGRRIAGALLVAIDATSPSHRDRARDEALSAAAAYGRLAAAAGGEVADTVEAFFRFRSIFVDELAQVARRQGLDTGESTRLVLDAVALADRLLPALLSGLEAGSATVH
jgi:excisionase family DNA binding protein